MKTKYIIIILSFFSAFSCIDDKSDIGLKEISTIEYVDGGLEPIYRVDKPDMLILGAPQVKQSNIEKPLQYEWQVDHKVVSTEDTLRYPCTRLTKPDELLNCRLKIYNDDGAIFQTFLLEVNANKEGIMIMSKYNGESLISFKRTDRLELPAIRDAYTINNPTIPLGKEPGTLFYDTKHVYVTTSTPTKVVTLDIQTFSVTEIIDIPAGSHITNISGHPYFTELCMLGNGKFYNYDIQSNFPFQSTWESFPVDAKFSDKSVFMYDYTYFQMGYTLWEETKNELWIYLQSGITPYSLTGDKLKDKELLAIMPCYYTQNLLLAVKDNNGNISMVQYAPDKISPVYGGSPIPPLGQLIIKEIPANSNMNENSVFLTRSAESTTYYTKGNAVYMYDYIGGNFEPKPIIKVGNNEDQIVAMVFSPDETKLYIGVNSPNESYKGSLYCYDVTTYKLLWSESAMAGEIVSMIYKGDGTIQ